MPSSTFLINDPWISVAAFLAVVVVGLVLGRWLVPRPGLARVLVVASLVPVVSLTLWPTGPRAATSCAVQWALPTPHTPELLANVVVFVLPALLATVVVRRPVLVLLAGSLLSAAIETVQQLAPGIGRACDTTDWLCNTIGAAVGVVLGAVAFRTAKR